MLCFGFETRKKLPKNTLVQKTHAKNVDGIDGNNYIYMPTELKKTARRIFYKLMYYFVNNVFNEKSEKNYNTTLARNLARNLHVH